MRDTILAVLRAMRDQLGRLPTADELFAETVRRRNGGA
jgi:hypothetical protein